MLSIKIYDSKKIGNYSFYSYGQWSLFFIFVVQRHSHRWKKVRTSGMLSTGRRHFHGTTTTIRQACMGNCGGGGRGRILLVLLYHMTVIRILLSVGYGVTQRDQLL